MRPLRREWRGVIDRRLFIPDTIWVVRDGWIVPLRRADEPDAWEAAVAADEPVIIQVDDGADNGKRSSHPTSSSSDPAIMERMLDELQVEPGMRVLEIGTGTGWNAALLASARAVVTSVEIDAALAERARLALAEAGYQDVTVVCGDGELGAPANAPYDRVMATAAVHTVPYPWVEQTVEGGLLVVPYTGEHHPGGLAVLTVTNGTATGPIIGKAAFMPLRSQRLSQRDLQAIGEPQPGLHMEITRHGQRIWRT